MRTPFDTAFGLAIMLSEVALGQAQVQAQAQARDQALGQDRGEDSLRSAVLQPTAANVAAWRAHILPSPDELCWETIPWHPTFGAGILAADAQNKPLLFYAMNGHPLGCT